MKNLVSISLLIFMVSACSPKNPSTLTASTTTTTTPVYQPLPNPTWTPDPREAYQAPSIALCTELSTWDQTYDINVDMGGDNYEVFEPGFVSAYDAQDILDDQANATIDLVDCSVTVVAGEITAVTACGGTTGVVCP